MFHGIQLHLVGKCSFTGEQTFSLQVGQSRNQIQRYIRLTELIPELMDMVDEKKIALNPAYELSFLKKEEQVDLLEREGVACSLSIASNRSTCSSFLRKDSS